MSTSAVFEDVDRFEKEVASVRSDSSKDRYLIVGHVERDPHRVDVLCVGEDVSELGEHVDDSQVMYILARYESTFDMSNTVKFVYFRWLGDKIPFVMKGKYGVVHGSIQEKFNSYHTFIETGNKEDLDTVKVMQQLEETTGKVSKVLESIEGRQERGFTATQLPKRQQLSFSGGVPKGGAGLEISPEVFEGIAAVKKDGNPTSWLLAEYRDRGPNGPIDCVASGSGDICELKSYLADDKVMYGLYRVIDIVDDYPTVKFVYIVWVGTKVKPMTKAKVSTHKGVMEAAFQPAHSTISASDQSDITENDIMAKVTAASGSKSFVM